MSETRKMSSLRNRFITKVTRDEITGELRFHDARKNVMFRISPESILDERGERFEDDIET